METFISHGDEETLEMGRRLAGIIPDGAVVALVGDLGCGKTVTARGIARGMGITEHVTSPTFTVAQEYRSPSGRTLYHLDMYRISDENAALAFGIDEFLFQKNTVTLVEWPERIAGLLDDPRLLTISYRHIDQDSREISFQGPWKE